MSIFLTYKLVEKIYKVKRILNFALRECIVGTPDLGARLPQGLDFAVTVCEGP